MNSRRRSRAVFEPYVVPAEPLPDDAPVGPQPAAPE
jgi:hypothetical protein